MRIYGYLRASTKEQDANRAKEALQNFADANNLEVNHYFVENASGNKLDRPELMNMINIAASGDAILIEQIDRLTRLKFDEWEQLKDIIKKKELRIISLDLPQTHIAANDKGINGQMIAIINQMFIDMLALMAYKDYEDRKRRQAEGIKKAKEKGLYKGRQDDTEKQLVIESLLKAGNSYRQIINITGCSNYLISKVNNRLKASK